MTRVVIIGAGGHAQVVADILLHAEARARAVAPVGYLDDDPALSGRAFLGLPVLGPLSELPRVAHDAVIVAIGDNSARASIFEGLERQGERFARAIHPSAVLGSDLVLGRGIMICAGVVVNTATRIGDNAILNTGCTVDHHNRIGAHAHVAPGAHTGGGVEIGQGTFLGIGSVVLPGKRVGDWAIVGGGAAVVRDVPPYAIAVGVPARVVSGPDARPPDRCVRG